MSDGKWSLRQNRGQKGSGGAALASGARWVLYVGDAPARPEDDPPKELAGWLKTLNKMPAKVFEPLDPGFGIADRALANNDLLRIGERWFDPDERGRFAVFAGLREGSISHRMGLGYGDEVAPVLADLLHSHYGTTKYVAPPPPPPPPPPTDDERRHLARCGVIDSLGVVMHPAAAKRFLDRLDDYLALTGH